MKKTGLICKIKELFRTIGGMIFLTAALLSLSLIMFVVSCSSQCELHKYQQYYQATETLLDSLESNFNWIDAYDPGPAYDNYIKARKKLKHYE